MPTNAKTPGKWPSYATDCRIEAQALAKLINVKAKEAQLHILAGQGEQAVVVLGDIRDCANGITWQMVQAASGIYEESAAIQDAARAGRAS